jgi:type II secretory pathway component GspD/PulD (secretin)
VNATIKPVDTGIFLTAVPVVGEGMVNMDLNLRLVTHTGFDGTGAPTLNSRVISNSIAVAPEDEIIFGGLVRERKIQETRKIPLLGSLPWVGYLFGGEITTNKKTVVVASVQPHLVVNHDNVTPGDRDAVAKTAGEKVLVLPESEFCFEQNVPLIH